MESLESRSSFIRTSVLTVPGSGCASAPAAVPTVTAEVSAAAAKIAAPQFFNTAADNSGVLICSGALSNRRHLGDFGDDATTAGSLAAATPGRPTARAGTTAVRA